MLIHWIFRELRNNKRFISLLVLNLAIGLAGFLGLSTFKEALKTSVQENSKTFLSADVAISTRRLFSEAEIAKIERALPAGAETSRLWEFFSMVVTQEGSRLVQVKAVDNQYPFYGDLELSDGEKIVQHSAKNIIGQKTVWVYPELLTQLNAKIGDELKLGQETFKIAETVRDDSTQTFRLGSLAPKVFVGVDQIRASNLIATGSTLTEAILIKLADERSLDATVEELKKAFPDSSVRIITYKEAGEDTARTLSYLSDYLSLVSLVALFLAALGSAYLCRSFIFSRLRSVAIYNSLGLSRNKAMQIYYGQLVFIGIASAVLAFILSWALMPILVRTLQEFAPSGFTARMEWQPFLLALAVGIGSSVLVGAPFLSLFRNVPVAALFHEETAFREVKGINAWPFVALFIFYWGLSIWQAGSFKIGSLFFGLFSVSLFLLLVLGRFFFVFLRQASHSKGWIFRHAFLGLHRRPLASLAALVSVGLGALLVNLMPQLRTGLDAELSAPRNLVLPSIFLFDIQDDQVEPLREYATHEGIELQYISPMVRGRIVRVNNRDFERTTVNGYATREEEEDARFRNRGVNISYRSELSKAETVVEGKFFKGSYDASRGGLPELSLEKRYADRLGLKMGDELLFDIQGVEIAAKITSFRTVKWNSFQPNFFIVIQPGVFEDAPKTFLAGLPKMPEEKVLKVQTELGQKFPNVSQVDVARVIAKVFEISDKMAWSLKLMAWLSFLAGFVVLGSLAHHQALSRRWDLNLLKVLGASRGKALAFVMIEFATVGFVASVIGVILSIAITWMLSKFVFDGEFAFQVTTPLLTIVGIVVLSCALSAVVFWRVLQERPILLLQSGRQES